MNEALIRYCKTASMESLRGMADEFALAHEDAELEIVCDEIEKREFEDQKITKAWRVTKAWCEKHVTDEK